MVAMPELAYTRLGDGQPLVLIHGLGSSRRAWEPVTAALSGQFDVISLDLPGFGATPPLPPSVEPTPEALARTVAETLRTLSVEAPHVVGNSLGGWIALELAGQVPVASLTLLSPAGLWKAGAPRYCRWSLQVSRTLARRFGRVLGACVRTRVGRAMVLGQTMGRPTQLSAASAREAIEALGSCPGFPATLRATLTRRYVGQLPRALPVTVMFGARDRILLRRQSRRMDTLPAGVRTVTLAGVGHVPMADDPDAVAALIRATAFSVRSG